MNPITIEEIQNMTPEEVAALNSKLTRQLGKQMLTRIALGVAAGLAVRFVMNRLDPDLDDEIANADY